MRYLLTFIVLLVPTLAGAQDKKPGDAMIEKYLAAQTDKLSAKFLDGAKTIDEWKAKRPRLYQEYMDMLGLWPIPEKTPLKATLTGTVEAHGVVVENVHFQSKPGLYVTANVYRPKAQGRPSLGFPAIVYVCGHSGKGRDGVKTAFQDHGFWFANHGYVCIVIDTLQLGEIPGVHHGTYGRPWGHLTAWGVKDAEKMKNHNRFWWHSIGYSPAAVECWNGMRAIDYLCTRDDVDPDKIGVTGISGGGAATFWIAAADERVKVAVPVSGMADLDFYVKQKGVNGHCDCMFLYNTYQWDWTTIAALVAPRPMLFANSNKDPIFPMDANRRIINKLYKVYDMYNMEQNIDECVSDGGHDYRPDLRIPIFQFFNRHLKRDTKSKVEDSAKYTPIEGKKLRVFPTDADLPKDAINHRIDETFIPAAKVVLPEKGKFAEWKKGMLADLERRSMRLKDEKITASDELDVNRPVHFLVLGPGARSAIAKMGDGNAKAPIATLFVTTDDYDKGIRPEQLEGGWGLAGYGMIPRDELTSVGKRGWTTNSPPNFVERSHVLLGSTVDRGKILDVLTAIRTLDQHHKQQARWRLVGGGRGAMLAAYAALYDSRVSEVVVIDPPKSHKEGPHFLNVLRVLDIPEALGLLAPMPLTIVGGLDPAFDRTEEIYRLAGAGDKLKRK